MQIKVAFPLDNKQHQPLDYVTDTPLAIELTSGDKCHAVDSNDQYDGLPVRYRCERQGELIGHVQRCEGMWENATACCEWGGYAQIARAWF